MSTPIIHWMGGKRRLADHLIPLFPPHECYVEVFAGGATLYFMKPQPSPVEVLNDINGNLVTLYRVVQNHLEEFVRPAKPTTFLSCDNYLIFLSTGREHGKYCLNELLAENGTPRKQD